MLVLAAFAAEGQAPSPPYVKPNNSYGPIWNRGSFDSTLFFPTGCGVPTDTTWLFSQQNGGRAEKLRKFAIYGDSCGNKAYLWFPSLQAWQPIGAGAGIDTLYSRSDSAFYTKDSVEHFAFILGTGGGTISTTKSITGDGSGGSPVQLVNDATSPGNSKYYGTDGSGSKGYYTIPAGGSDSAIAGRNGVKVAVVGTTRYLDADSAYVATRARLQKSLDSINLLLLHWTDTSGHISSRERLQKVADSLGAVKVANYLGVSYLGYGSHAARPTSGTGLYWDTDPDSPSLYYVNGASYTNLLPALNIFVRSLNPAYPDTNYIQAVGGNLLVSPLWDSVGNCIKHLIYPDGRLVWYSTCTTPAFDSLTTQGGVFHTGAYNDVRYQTKIWVRTGNLTSPVNVGDSVAIGGSTPQHRLHVIGDAAFDFRNLNPATTFSNSFQFITRQQVTGGTNLTLNDLYLVSAVSSGDTAANLNMISVDPGGISGKALNFTGLNLLGGTYANINNLTGINVQSATTANSFVGINLNVPAGTNNYPIYSVGAAASYFAGAIGIANLAPAASSLLDIVSTSKGVLLPRMTTTQMLAISSPASGLTVFNTDSVATGHPYAYWDGVNSVWRYVGWDVASGGTPGGSSGQVQYNNSGAFGGDNSLTHNSTTKTTHADSLDAKEVFIDSALFRTSSTFTPPSQQLSTGNSITAGTGPSTPTLGYAYLYAAQQGLPINNVALGGSGAWYSAGALYKNMNPGNPYLTTAMFGFNDLRRGGADGRTHLKILAGLQVAYYNQFLKVWYPAGISNAAITRYGAGWQTTYTASVVGGKSVGNGAYSPTKGDSLVYSFQDSTVLFGLMGTDSSAAARYSEKIYVYLDNALTDSLSENNRTDGISDGVNGNTIMPFIYVKKGLAYGQHKIAFVNKTNLSYPMVIDFVGNLTDRSYAYPLLVFEVPHMPATGYPISPANSTQAIVDAMNVSIDSLFAAITNGYPVFIAKTNNYYRAIDGVDVNADHIHPSDLGAREMDTAGLVALPKTVLNGRQNTVVNVGRLAQFYGGKIHLMASIDETLQSSSLANLAFLNTTSQTGSFTADNLISNGTLRGGSVSGTVSNNPAVKLFTGGSSFLSLYKFSTDNYLFSTDSNYTTGVPLNFEAGTFRFGKSAGGSFTNYLTIDNANTYAFDLTGGVRTSLKSFFGDSVILNKVPDAANNDSLLLEGANHTVHKAAVGSGLSLASGVLSATGGASAPFADNVALVKNNSDATKLAIFSAAGLTTATTRTYGLPDFNGIFAMTNHAQTFTNLQSFTTAPNFTGTSTTGWVWTATDNAGNGGWAAAAGSGLADPGSNGIVKRTASNTTAIAIASDFPTLNQNTTGNAATATNLSAAVLLPTGTTAATPSPGDNSSKLAPTAYVDAAVAAAGGTTSGSYVPTITGTNHISTITADTTFWIRNGNIVTVTGSCTVTASTTGGGATFDIQLPATSHIGSKTVAGGGSNNTGLGYGIVINGNVSTGNAQASYSPSATSTDVVKFWFMYKVY